jgi:hypothetical protein
LAELFGLDIGGGARGTERHARGEAHRDRQPVAGAIVPSRAISHVAHDRAGELTEVNRALPGSWAAQKGEAALSIAGKLTK